MTSSVLGSVGGVELATGVSYDVLVKVPSVSTAESVADIAIFSERMERL